MLSKNNYAVSCNNTASAEVHSATSCSCRTHPLQAHVCCEQKRLKKCLLYHLLPFIIFKLRVLKCDLSMHG